MFHDSGDWFFVHLHTDNSTDTRFRDVEQHQLKFNLFPSFSIWARGDLLFYKNASVAQLPSRFLRQDQVMMKAQFSFDLFNSRKRGNRYNMLHQPQNRLLPYSRSICSGAN